MTRLVLFDIDETMISSDGAGRRALAKAFKEKHNIDESAVSVPMSGKTDPQIIMEIFTALGHDQNWAKNQVNELIECYLGYLDQELAGAGQYIMHEGVLEILDVLETHPHCHLGLLTGNVERGARKKLERFKLNRFFEIGAYGCDSANRLDLPEFAVKRAESHFETKFVPQQVVIIGDSVNDIACAHGYGARALAVNTGRTSWDDLAGHKPHTLLKNLADTQTVLKAILE
jgi:phosphoglycolate phosphatase